LNKDAQLALIYYQKWYRIFSDQLDKVKKELPNAKEEAQAAWDKLQAGLREKGKSITITKKDLQDDPALKTLWDTFYTDKQRKWLDLEKKVKDYEKEKEESGKAIKYLNSLPLCDTGYRDEFKKDRFVGRWEPGAGQLFGETISVVTGTDNEVWCTYGDGVGLDTTITETDEYGVPLELITSEETISEEASAPEGEPAEAEVTPAAPETPKPPEETQPSEGGPALVEGTPVVRETPKPPEETPTSELAPETPKPPETLPEQPPAMPETPPVTEDLPETPSEQPPSTPTFDTIFYKVNEEELEELEKQTEGPPPVQEEVVKLLPTDDPDLPGTGTKEANDTNSDGDPVQGTTDAQGEGKMQVLTKDRALYGLPSTDEKPGKYYRLDYGLPQQSGGVVETTGESTKLDLTTGTPEGAEITAQEFKIGKRNFARLRYKQPYGLKHDFNEQFRRAYGPKYEVDDCRVEEPAPPLGMQSGSLSALNHELPETAVNFEEARARGNTP
jgi:hypothetical protein